MKNRKHSERKGRGISGSCDQRNINVRTEDKVSEKVGGSQAAAITGTINVEWMVLNLDPGGGTRMGGGPTEPHQPPART
eukprot:COSAG01_NODE_26593_length_708_cov_12.443350_1_plen_78_part_10